jgi:hypothetical protein
MKQQKPSSIYQQVVKVTHTYLGPAAERFIDRQVENHLHKPPSKITKADLLKLIDWIRVIVSLITEDTDIVEEYISELHKLTISSPTNKRKGHNK